MVGEEAGAGDKKLVEEDACADLAGEQAGCHLRGESSSLSIDFYVLVCSSISPLFPLQCALISVPSRPNFGFALGLVPVLLFPAQPAPALGWGLIQFTGHHSHATTKYISKDSIHLA